jgi:tetratricopeptide (TPR) repeat protein
MQAVTNLRLGQAYLALGDCARARERLQHNVEVLRGDLVHERFGEAGFVSVLSRVWLLQALTEQGEFAQGIVRGEEAIRIAESSNDPFSLVAACRGLGYLFIRKGDLKLAVGILERSHELCRTWNIPTWYFGVAAFLGYGYVLSGRVAEGMALLERMIEQSIAMGHRNAYARPFVQLSEAYRLAGRVDDALRVARQALDFDRVHKRAADEAWALRTLGEIALHRDPLEAQEAETSYRDALARAEALDMRPLVAHCHVGLGELYRRLGKRHESRAHLGTAAAMYGAMDMRPWLEQAEAVSRRF